MRDRIMYCVGNVEAVVSEMDFSNVADDVAEIDDALELWIKGYVIVIPSLGICVRKGIACMYDKDTNMFMPESDATVICGRDHYGDVLYFKQDNILSTLESYLDDRSVANITTLGLTRISDVENLECYIEILNESN